MPSRLARMARSGSVRWASPHTATSHSPSSKTSEPLPAVATAPEPVEAARSLLPSKRLSGTAIFAMIPGSGAPRRFRSNHPHSPLMRRSSNEYLRRSRVAQKCDRARGQTVSTRLEHDDEVADPGLRHLHAVGEKVERRAQRPDHVHDLTLLPDDPVTHDYGIVLAYDLSEVAGRGQVLVQAAVGYQEHLAARNLAVEDTAGIDSRLAHEVATELDPRAGLR